MKMTPIAAALLASTAFAAPALAQSAAQETDQGTGVADVTEIVVTAQKIEQRAVDVPITISARPTG